MRLSLRLRSALVVSFVSLASAFAMACGAPVTVKSGGADVGGVARYKTYSHDVAASTPPGVVKTELALDVIDKARSAVDADLQKKGYALATDGHSDVVVRITTSSHQILKQPVGTTARVGAPAELETVGKLVIEIVEASTKGNLVHAEASKEIHVDHADAKEVDEVVGAMLKEVPIRQSP